MASDRPDDDFSLGVEEEYQLLDVTSGDLRQANDKVLAAARCSLGEQVQPELLRSQVEVATAPCRSLDDLDGELRRLRRRVSAAAASNGCRLGAAGSHPFARWQGQQVSDKERYRSLARHFQQLARETLVFGCHVHVGIADPDGRIAVMNAVRRWLPLVLACSANSPFSAGTDSGYASYRTVMFRRWPQTGMPQQYRSWEHYCRVLDAMVAAGAVDDATNLYWDVRPSGRFPTLEVRIADVCLSVEDAVTVAGIVQALAWTAAAEREDPRDRETSPTAVVDRPELLDAAVWRAARFGLHGELLDVSTAAPAPAGTCVERLRDHLRPGLEALGTGERVLGGIDRLLRAGNGADRQRRAYAARRELTDVVAAIAAGTAEGL